MYIVMGATGHVGGAVARALLMAGRDVVVLTRHADRASGWRERGAQVAELDVRDVDALRAAFKRGRRAYLLNPPAPPSTDTDREERATVRSMLAALEGSGLEMVVAASTYGAQPGDRLGDLSVLYALEQGLQKQPIPATLVRGAYYFSNFDELLEPARDGVLPTMMPAELRLPMVAPEDLGLAAAELLMAPGTERRLLHVEGPERHSHADVAQAFAKALGKPVEPLVTPRDRWESTFGELGFSREAAHAYARMIGVSVDGGYELPAAPLHGGTTLQQYIDALARA